MRTLPSCSAASPHYPPQPPAAVPDELIDAVALVGPKERFGAQLRKWQASPVTTLLIATSQVEALRTLAEFCL